MNKQQSELGGGHGKLNFLTIKATPLRKSRVYYWGYFVVANTVFGYLIPLVFLVIINVLIVKTLNAEPTKAEIMVAKSVVSSKGKALII